MTTLCRRCVPMAALLLALAPAGGGSADEAEDPGAAGGEGRPAVVLTDRARRLHAAALVADGHNDLPWVIRNEHGSHLEAVDLRAGRDDLQTDIPKLRAGGVDAQLWSAYVPSTTIAEGGAAVMCLEQIHLIRRMVARYPDVFALAVTADDVERVVAEGKIASLIGIEGGHTIENSLGALGAFADLGVRYVTLTHADTTDWCDAATDTPRHGGLSLFGERVVLEMNRLGVLPDISHVSPEAMRDTLRVSRGPVLASHSSAYAVAPHARNIPDDVLEMVRDNGGLVMVNFFSGFVDPGAARVLARMFEVDRQMRARYPDPDEYREAKAQWRRDNPVPRGTIHTVIDHIDHIAKVAGVDHVGLGSDYDGVRLLPEQLDDASSYPYITQALLDRGYSDEDVRKILGQNLLRVLREAEAVAAELRTEPYPPVPALDAGAADPGAGDPAAVE